MTRINNQVKTIVLLGGLSALLVGVGALFGSGFFYGAIALAVLLNVGAYFFSDRLVLRMYGAQEVGPDEAPHLHRIVDDLVQRAAMPKPRVLVIPAAYANAFATGRNPKHGAVAVTQGIMDLLTERELRGVLAHELAHIKNRDILVSTIAAVIAAAIGYLAQALSFAAFFGSSSDEEQEGGGGASALLVALVAPLAATLIQLGVSRAREYLADDTGARICGDPEALAAALDKLESRATREPSQLEPATASLFIVNPLAGGERLMRWFSTHPPMEERIRRLRGLAMDLRMGLAA
jgi:heat shock protein HtpX